MTWTASDADYPSTLPVGAMRVAAPGEVLADRYVLEALIGEGAAARVFAALDLGESPPRRVAVKVSTDGEGGEPARLRLAREAALLARVHARAVVPGLVRPLRGEVEVHEGWPFLALELIEGPSLRDVLSRRGSLGVGEALRLGALLARALAALHAAGVALGDLKPENIMLRGGVEPVIVDLGAAELAEPDPAGAEAGPRWMTPAYAAPEQLAGGRASAASDVYALGLLIGEVASGRAPISGAAALEDLPRAITRLLLPAVALDPMARPAASELAGAIEGASRGEVRARRRRLMAAAGVALVIAAGSMTWAPERAAQPVPPPAPVVIAGDQYAPQWLVLDQGCAVWSSSWRGLLMRACVGAEEPEVLVHHPGSINGLAAAGGAPFWIDGQGVVWTARGGTPVELARRPGVAGAITADARGVVWSDWTHGEVLALGPGGEGPVRVLARGQDHPEAVALDEEHVAWSNYGDGAVRIARREGGEALTIAAAEARPIRIALRDGYVYWANNGDGAVKRAAKSGGEMEVVARSLIGIQGLAVDARHVYWVNPDEGQVLRAPRTPSEGGAPEVLAARQAEPLDVAVDEAAVYWANGAVSGAIMRRAKPE